MKKEKFKVYCHKCKKDVELQQKMGGLICKKCSIILYYHTDSMYIVPRSEQPKNLEFGKGRK